MTMTLTPSLTWSVPHACTYRSRVTLSSHTCQGAPGGAVQALLVTHVAQSADTAFHVMAVSLLLQRFRLNLRVQRGSSSALGSSGAAVPTDARVVAAVVRAADTDELLVAASVAPCAGPVSQHSGRSMCEAGAQAHVRRYPALLNALRR